MTRPTFSLVVCTYGRTQELGRLFHSLAQQDCQDFELIVVDQNLDKRVAPCIDLAIRLGLQPRTLKTLRPNLSAARNAGIAQCLGLWIGFPDDDCWYEPSTLRRLRDRILSRQTGGIACMQWSEYPQSCDTDFSWQRSSRFRDPMLASFMLFFERQVLDGVGGFNPDLGVGQWFSAGEETDLVFRAIRHGVPGFFVSDAIVHHPLKELGRQPGGRKAVRCRARGVGAIYAIHNIPVHVVSRGMIAPLFHSVTRTGPARPVAEAFAEIVGRVEGMAAWKLRAVVSSLQNRRG